MSNQTDTIKALKFETPEFIPVCVWIPPSVWIKYGDKLRTITERHPIAFPDYQDRNTDYAIPSGTYMEGSHVDVWGCVWENIHAGNEAMVRAHPVKTREDILSLKLPTKNDGFPHGFMYLRILDLRGFEEAMIDFAEEPPELKVIIRKVLEHNLRQADIILKNLEGKTGEIIYFGDDLGMQTGLAMGAEKWRKYMKPCYMELYKKIKDNGHYVFMHTDGQIFEIIPDLIECGVDIINPQFRANGLDNLVRGCKGKVCVELDLDRQMFPFCKPKDINDHVKAAVKALWDKSGGLMLRGEVDDTVPLENIEAIGEALEKYRNYRG